MSKALLLDFYFILRRSCLLADGSGRWMQQKQGHLQGPAASRRQEPSLYCWQKQGRCGTIKTEIAADVRVSEPPFVKNSGRSDLAYLNGWMLISTEPGSPRATVKKPARVLLSRKSSWASPPREWGTDHRPPRIVYHVAGFFASYEYNLFQDYPYKPTKEEKALFDQENPHWRDFFADRQT